MATWYTQNLRGRQLSLAMIISTEFVWICRRAQAAAQLRQSGPWAARQHYNAAKLLVRIVYAAAQLRAPTRAPQSPPIAISGCKKPLAKSDLVLQNCGLASSCTTVCRDNEPIRKNLDLFMDNRFAQARLLVLLLASMHVYCTVRSG